MVPNTTASVNPGIPSIVYGSAVDSLGPNGADGVPVPDGGSVIRLDDAPGGASPRPDAGVTHTGQGPACGDPNFYESSIALNPTTPATYAPAQPPTFEVQP